MVVVDRKGDVRSCFMKVGSHLDVLEASWRCVEWQYDAFTAA